MTRPRLPLPLLAFGLAACGCMLASCDGDDAPRREVPAPASAEALPAPGSTAGRSVTGMPDAPGPGEVPLAGTPLPAAGDMVVEGVLPLEDNPETGLIMEGSIAPITPVTPVTPVDVAAGGEPVATPAPPMPVAERAAPAGASRTADAVAVVSAYYAALAAGQHGHAYGLWSDGGRSSGQTPEQFARGFAGATGVVAQPGEARVLAGGDAPQVEVPVSVTTTLADGRERRQVGAYVLRRSGSGAGPSAWRIVSAELRELQP
jgi:hypothetical protein